MTDWEFDMNDTLTEHTETFYRELILADRCDECPNQCSQAFARAVKVIDGNAYELLFCGHHFKRSEPKLIANGWLIQDERNRINQKPMSGAPEGAIATSED